MSDSSLVLTSFATPAMAPRRATRSVRRSSGGFATAVRRLVHRRPLNAQGAVIVEFTVVMVPLLITFFSFIQIGYLYQSALVLRHAAEIAARAAAVITVKEENNPNATGRPAEVTEAAYRATGLFGKSGLISNVKVNITDDSSARDPYGLVHIKLTATVACNVPMGGRIACFPSGKMKKTVEASYAHQGARYKVEPKGKK
jgi:Flp pilus assembly protein TadG